MQSIGEQRACYSFRSGTSGANEKPPKPKGSHYIPWHEILRRAFGEEVRCSECGGQLRLVAMVKIEAAIREFLVDMNFPIASMEPTEPPKTAEDLLREVSKPDELDWGGASESEGMDSPEYPD